MAELILKTKAPNSRLPSAPDHKVSLSDFKGQSVILAFYPADWSPVCSDQLSLYNELISDFYNHHAQLLGISVDGIWCHQAFAKQHHLQFPLLADFEPKGKVAKDYGVYSEAQGTSERALFVIDKEGMIHWKYISPRKINPGADGI